MNHSEVTGSIVSPEGIPYPRIAVQIYIRTSSQSLFDRPTMYSLIIGEGAIPDAAVSSLQSVVKSKIENMLEKWWTTYGVREDGPFGNYGREYKSGSYFVVNVEVVDTRIASGSIDGNPGWIAYGTLLVAASPTSRLPLNWSDMSKNH